MPKWTKGQSGNPEGRPKKGTAIAELARTQMEKYQLLEQLGRIGARKGEYAKVEIEQQLRAIQLLMAYGYGPPRAEIEDMEGVVIQVTYAQTNRIAIGSAACSPATSDTGGETVQRGLLRAPLGEDDAGDGSVDSPGTAG